jgi:alpha-1,6-mannosyltransferase
VAPFPPRIRLLIGIAGAIAITVGSYGVGWIAPLSGLHDIAALAALRGARSTVVASGVLVAGGAVLLLAAWLSLGFELMRRGRRPGPGGPRGSRPAESTGTAPVVVSAAAWTLPLLFSLPLFSRDMFAYLAQGRLVAAGLNPYENGVSSIPGWFGIGVDPLWADTPTPYGPVFVWLERIVAVATGSLPSEVGVFAFRLIAVAGLALLAYFAWRIAHRRGRDAAVVLWLVAASPLVLMNFVVAGHNDSLMLGLIVGGVFYALDRRPVLGAVLVALAIGVKPIAVIALPIIGIIWAVDATRAARESRTSRTPGTGVGVGAASGTGNATAPTRPALPPWGPLIRRWAAVAGIALGGIAVLGFALGVGVGWIAALSTPATISSWYAPANILGVTLGGFANAVGVDGEIVQAVVKIALLAAGCAVAAAALITRRGVDPLWLLLICFAAITLVSPVIHPWYALWLLAFLALAGLDGIRRIRLAVYGTAFFMLIGLAEPLDLVQRMDGGRLIPSAVIATSLVGVAGVLLLAEAVYARSRSGRALALVRTGRKPATAGFSASSTP